MWVHSSVVRVLTADQQVPGSNLGVPSILYFIAAHMNPAASLSLFFGQTCSAANVDLAQRFEWLIADQQDVCFVPPCFQGLTIKVSLSFWPLFSIGYIAQWLERLTADQQVPALQAWHVGAAGCKDGKLATMHITRGGSKTPFF